MNDFSKDLDAVARSGAGRRVLAKLISDATAGCLFSDNHAQMAFEAGRREMGMWLDARIREVNPDLWLLMQREALKTTEDEDKEPPHEDS